MKEFFKKLWAKIKKPVCIAAMVLLAGLFLFCVIDAFVRCWHQQIFNGIVQLAACGGSVPLLINWYKTLIAELKSE